MIPLSVIGEDKYRKKLVENGAIAPMKAINNNLVRLFYCFNEGEYICLFYEYCEEPFGLLYSKLSYMQ